MMGHDDSFSATLWFFCFFFSQSRFVIIGTIAICISITSIERLNLNWVVVSKNFYFHPYVGK